MRVCTFTDKNIQQQNILSTYICHIYSLIKRMKQLSAEIAFNLKMTLYETLVHRLKTIYISLKILNSSLQYCSWHGGLGPAGLPKSVEEVWRKEWIVMFMWCIYVCPSYTRCSMVILFTCVLVLSHPVVKGECTCETRIVGTNSKILGGPRQTRKIHVEETWQKAQSDPRTRPWRTYSRGAPRK
jgi:hypothetical protein